MGKMKRGLLIVVFIVIFVIAILYFGILFSDKEIRDKLNSNKNSEINNVVSDENTQNTDNDIINGEASENSDGSDNSAGGGGSGSDSSGTESSSGGSENNPDLNENSESSCVLVRPGNLPDIECSVNYIKNEGVSLNIKNELGEKIDIIINLDTCSPELQETLENLDEKEFAFSCENSGYFNKDISVTYILSGDKRIEIGGFVAGPLA